MISAGNYHLPVTLPVTLPILLSCFVKKAALRDLLHGTNHIKQNLCTYSQESLKCNDPQKTIP